MRKVKQLLALTLALSVMLCSFGAVTVSAEVTMGPNALFEIDFSDGSIATKDDLANVKGLSVSGDFDVATAPDGTNTLVLKKNVENPGTMEVKWDNGHANGEYAVQVELYQTGVSRKLMQAPITFIDLWDTDYNDGEGLEITRIAYDQDKVDELGIGKLRGYALLLAGISESSADNYIFTNTDKQSVNTWFSLSTSVDTTTGDCLAVSSTHPSQELLRTFEDESICGTFAPNMFKTVASSADTEHENDLYIKKITVTGPKGTASGDDNNNTPTVAGTSFFVSEGYTCEDGTLTDDENITVTSVGDMVVDRNLEKDPGDPVHVNINGKDCCYFVGVRANSEPTDYASLSAVGGKGSPIDFSPKKDGTLDVYYRLQEGKGEVLMKVMEEDGTFVNFVDGTWTLYSENILPESERAIEVEYGTQTFELEAGKTYVLYTTGWTCEMFGYTFLPEGAELPTVTDKPVVYPNYTISEASIDNSNKLSVSLTCDKADAKAKLIVASFNNDKTVSNVTAFDINGTEIINLADYTADATKTTKLYVWDSLNTATPLANAFVIDAKEVTPDTPVYDPNRLYTNKVYTAAELAKTDYDKIKFEDWFGNTAGFDASTLEADAYEELGEPFGDLTQYTEYMKNGEWDFDDESKTDTAHLGEFRDFTVVIEEDADYSVYAFARQDSGPITVTFVPASDDVSAYEMEATLDQSVGTYVGSFSTGDGTGPWQSSGPRNAAIRKATVSLTPGEWKVKFDNQSWLFCAFKIEGGPIVDIPTQTAAPTPTATVAPTEKPTDTPVETETPTAAPTLDPNGIYDLNTDTTETNKVTLAQASSGTTAEYKTLGEAIAKAKELNPTKEEERVVISLMPGVYREVNTLETPYVTIKKDDAAEYHNVEPTWGVTDTNKTGTYLPDAKKEVILTFYYGIGYTYDSCQNVEKWGACFYAKGSATDLIVEDIVFENSYNRYMANAELADNPKPQDGYKERNASIDVASEAYNERSACLYTDAVRASYIGCKLLGAQDTFGLNGRAYLKDCYIEGRTDYICGLGTAYIEDTTLMFYGYSDSTKSGVITAMQGPASGEDYGVLFNNCYIGNTKSSTTGGSFGRPWRQPAFVVFTNSTLENNKNLIGASGWGGMSSNTPELATFREWNSKYTDGTAVDVSKRVEGTVLDEWTMLEHNPYNYTARTDGWDPANVVATYKGVNDVLATTTVEIPAGSDNKVSLPAAPEGYEFKWVSNSEYAVVNDDNTVTVIRPANGEAPIESTVILYVREKANNAIGNKKVIPVTISATTDLENVFTLSGTVSMKKASDVDVNVTVKAYLGDALIKATEVTIPKGETSVTYEAKNIPVGTYDVKYDCTTEYHQITAPTDGKTSVTGAKGDTKTVDATVQALSPVHYDITTAPTAIGKGVTVTDNKDGSFLVKATSGVTGGAYWNLVDCANEGLKTTQSMTVSYRLTITDAPFTNKDGANGASIDVLTNTAKTFTSDVNTSRALRTLFGRWDQVNMIGSLAGGLSGASNDGNQWLNPSGYKFDKAEKVGTAFDITVTVDFKNEVISATSKLVGSEETKSYTFDGFPTDIDRSNSCLAVYTGSKAASEYQISNIAVDYTAIVD